jgi:hypothetical protein
VMAPLVLVGSQSCCCRAPLLLNQSSSPDAIITISPLIPHSFVDCCFKRRTKPLLPTMVPSLSSRLPSLVGCFRCPPPPILAASHGRRHQQSFTLTASASTSPSSSPGPPVVVSTPPAVGQRAIAVVAAAAAAVEDDADVRLRVIVVLVVPAIPPPLTAVESVDCPHRMTSSDWPLATRRLACLTAIPRSPAIGPVVQRRCTASRRRRRRRRHRRRRRRRFHAANR